jgi:hypothetical protein
MIKLIGISGKIGSGKDEVFNIIKEVMPLENWENQKFAKALKVIAGMLLGVSPDRLEDRDFKEGELGEEWWCYDIPGKGLFPRNCFTANEDNRIAEQRYLVKLTPRVILQKLGTEGGRMAIHPNIWVNALFANFDEHCDWVVTDVRFLNEVQAIKDRGGIVIRVNRPGHEGTGSHLSETALDGYRGFDYVINNDGTLEDLKKSVEKVFTNSSK